MQDYPAAPEQQEHGLDSCSVSFAIAGMTQAQQINIDVIKRRWLRSIQLRV